MEPNPVKIVSLGPGEAELITLKGFRALQQADAIYCPATLSADGRRISRAAEILRALGFEAPKCRLFELPMSKDGRAAEAVYGRVAGEIAANAGSVRTAVVAEGDAGFYSSVHYIGDRLAGAGVAVEYVAGVPAFIAAGACAGLHVAKRGEPLTVLPAVADAGRLTALLEAGHTVVVMKLSQNEAPVKEAIRRLPDGDWHYFEQVGTPEELHLTDPARLLARPFAYFSLLLARRRKPL